MFYGAILVLHIISCLFLIAVILLQAGRGGGFSEVFGGSQTQNIFGTKTPQVLTRATTITAIVYITSAVLLGVVSAHQNRPLVERMKLPPAASLPQPAQPEPVSPAKAQTSQETPVKPAETKSTHEAANP